jgi:hypothetical protein
MIEEEAKKKSSDKQTALFVTRLFLGLFLDHEDGGDVITRNVR